MGFKLVQGVSAENFESVHSAFSVNGDNITAQVSAEHYEALISDLIKRLSEPVFFFVEFPCTADDEKKLRKSEDDPMHYNLYYLDNCTLPVAGAIMKRYGQVLINDGLCRFGFGSHKDNEEIYCVKYQIIYVYGKADKYRKCFEKHGIPNEENFVTLWDTFTNDSPGISSAVEVNGETVNDIIENLKAEGLYFADVVEE